jgi:hypothetical protein
LHPKGTRKHKYGLSRADVEAAFVDYTVLRAEVDRA